MSLEMGRRVEAALGELLLRRTRAHLYDELGGAIDATSYPVLSGIARLGPVTAARLASEVGMDRSGASRHATRLQQAGLLERVPDPQDARAILLLLTDKGHRVVAEQRAQLASALGHQLAAWPADHAQTFVEGLERFAAENREASLH